MEGRGAPNYTSYADSFVPAELKGAVTTMAHMLGNWHEEEQDMRYSV